MSRLRFALWNTLLIGVFVTSVEVGVIDSRDKCDDEVCFLVFADAD